MKNFSDTAEGPKFRLFTGDRVLWIIVATLAVISVLVVYSSTAKMAYDAHTARTTAHFLRQQLFILGGCMFVMLAVQKINSRIYHYLAAPVYYLSVLLTLGVYFFGVSANGAARWIPIGSFLFQPSEALKVATVLFLARQLAARQSKIDKIRIVPSWKFWTWRSSREQRRIWRDGTWPILVPMLVSCLVIFPAHFSSALLVFMASWVMMLIGRVRFRELMKLVVWALVVVLLSMLFSWGRGATAEGRFSTWANLWTHTQTEKPIEELTDTERSMIAIHNGGILGEGAGQRAMRVIGRGGADALPVDFLPGHRDFPPLRHGFSGAAGLGTGVADNVSGAAAYHGHGQSDSRNGADAAADFARRVVGALHLHRPGDDSQRQPSERGAVARHAQGRNDLREVKIEM